MIQNLRYGVLLVLLALAASVFAQDTTPQPADPTIVLITPTLETTATPPPVVDRSPSGVLNPQPAELPILDTTFSIDIARKDGYVITDFTPVYVREGAGVEYRPVAVALGGVFLDATGVNEEQTWWRVRTANGAYEGWINAELLILRGDLTNVPVVTPAEMGDTLPITFVTFAPQPLYRAPVDDESLLLCTIVPDEDALLAQTQTGDFYQIIATCEGGGAQTGWISAEAGALRNPTAEVVPVVLGPFAPDEDALNRVNGPALLVFRQQTVYTEPRVRPSTAACDIAPNRYPVIARDVPADWYLIRAACLDGTTVDAWIRSTAGAFQNDTALVVPIAVTPTAPNVTPIPADAPRLLTFLPQVVLNAPDGAPVCELDPGEHRIGGVTPGGEFYRVTTTCADGTPVTGWLSAEAGAFRNPTSVSVPVVE